MASGNIRLIGITGMGGLGKSTLAAKIYQDDSAEFSNKFWADVSRAGFTELARRVLLRLGLSQATVDGIPEISLVDVLINHLRQGKYLLIIDNLESWLTEDGQWLNQIYQDFFLGWIGCGGESVVLVTTRERPTLPEIKSQWLPLSGLSPVEGAALLRDLGIRGGDEELQEFAKKAEGHPLLLTLVAGFLRVEEEGEPQISYLQHYGLADVSNLLIDESLQGLHHGKVDVWMLRILEASFTRIGERLRELLLGLSVYRLPFNAVMAGFINSSVGAKHLGDNRSRETQILDPNASPCDDTAINPNIPNPSPCDDTAINPNIPNPSPLSDSPTNSNIPNSSVGAKHLGDNLSRETQILAPNASPCDDTAINPNIPNPSPSDNSPPPKIAPPQPDRAKHSENNISSNPKIAPPNASPLQIERESDNLKIKPIEEDLRQLAKRSLLQEERDKDRVRWFQFQPFIQEYAKHKAGDLTAAHQRAINYYLSKLKSPPWQTKEDIKEYLEVFYHYCQLKEYIPAFDILRRCDYFLTLRGYSNIRVELYGELVQEWNLSKSEWQFAASLNDLGNAYKSLGQYQLAIEYDQESKEIFEEIGDRHGIANSLGNLGNAYDSLGQYQLAIEYHQQSKEIKEEIGDRHGIADSLNNLGNAYNSLGQYQLAIEYHQQSKEIKEEIGDRSGIATSLNNLGNAYNSLGQYQLAIEYYQQSKEIKEEIGNRSGIAKSLNNLGSAYNSLGQYQLAIEYHQQSKEIFEEIGDRHGIATSLNNLGNAYNSLGQYQLAIEYYQQSKEIKEEIGDRHGIANSLNNLGNAYDSLGQYQLAIEYHQQSKEIKEEIGDRHGIADSLNNLGNAYNSLGQYQLAIEYHQQSKEIFEEIGDRHGIAKSLNNLGNAYDSLGQYQLAIEYYQQSKEIKEEIGDSRGEANAWFNLGNTLAKLRQKSAAITAYQNARLLFQAMELDQYVQMANNEIEGISQKSPPWVSLPKLLANFLLRWLHKLWRVIRALVRR